MLSQLQSKNLLSSIAQKPQNSFVPRSHLQPRNHDKFDNASNLILPQIDGSKNSRKEHNTTFSHMNASVDISAQLREDACKENRNNISFDSDRAKAYNMILGGLDGNKIKTNFTKNFLYMYKDEGIQTGTREKVKSLVEEEKKRLLNQKLEEIKKRKDMIIHKIAENQKELMEREKFMDKMKKIANEAATKIQKAWRRYIARQKVLRGVIYHKVTELQYKVIKTATEKLNCFSLLLNSHKMKMEQSIIIIQRNARKFLARRRYWILWRKKIAKFIQNKLIDKLHNILKRESFFALRDNTNLRNTNDVAFFITSNIDGATCQTENTDTSRSYRRFSSPTRFPPRRSRSSLRKTNESLMDSKSSLKKSPSRIRSDLKLKPVSMFDVASNIKEITNEEEEHSPTMKTQQKWISSPKVKRDINEKLYHRSKTTVEEPKSKDPAMKQIVGFGKRKPLQEKNSNATSPMNIKTPKSTISKDALPKVICCAEDQHNIHINNKNFIGVRCTCPKCKGN